MILKFSQANAKTKHLVSIEELAQFPGDNKKVYSFDLLSGWSCPGAHDCLSKVIQTKQGRRIKDGKNTKFRCFSASQEVVYPPVYNARKANYETVKRIINKYNDPNILAEHINLYMPKNLGICRIHVGGDFFNHRYFKAWIHVAQQNPDKLFYAYTNPILGSV